MKRRQMPDFVLFVTTLLLLIIGIIMVFSASYVVAKTRYLDGFYFLKRQIVWAFLGIIGMTFMMKVDYSVFKKWSNLFFIIALILLILVLIPGVGINVKGSTRWLGIGTLNFQPSEIAKLALVFFLAKNLSLKGEKIQSFFHGLLPQLLIVGVVCALILFQPDLGTAVVIAGTSYLLILVAGARWSHMTALALIGVLLVGLAIYVVPYRMERFTAFLNPWADPLDSGFHTIQSLYAVGSGQLLGLGLGQGKQKFLYLPEQHTDFIYAVISEELGFLGSSFVLLLFFVFLWRGLKIALRAPDLFGIFLATGITAMVALQALINIGVVLGCLPVTGITLPLVSCGGSSLTLTLCSIGIMLNISCYAGE